MESYAKNSLSTFLLVFMILSALMWITSYIPAVKEAMHKLQDGLFLFFGEPWIGLVFFGTVLLIYFTVYYVNPSPLDLSEKYISNFTNIWIIFISLVVLSGLVIFRKG
jgi:hypothetical protein